MAYYFFMDSVMLPVPPPKMTVKIKNKNKTFSLVDEGEINIIKSPGLSEIAFDIELPNSKYPFANYDTSLSDSLVSAISRKLLGANFKFKDAKYFLEIIEKFKTKQIPFRFIVMRMTQNYRVLFDTNFLVTLEEYSIIEDAKNGLDVTVPIRLKQYRPYGTKELEITTDENGNTVATVKQTRSTEGKEIDNLYQIRNEQSIWEACKRASGGSLDWRAVMNLNNMTNPTAALPRGQVLNFGL